MGTKRALAANVCSAIVALKPERPIVDLFSGMGAVANTLAPSHSIVTNDLLQFTAAFARTRFLSRTGRSASDALAAVLPHYKAHHARLAERFQKRLRAESAALATPESMLAWMDRAPHVGRSEHYRRAARRCAVTDGWERYALAVLYFSGGFFSTAQAIQIDSLRYAIDAIDTNSREREWLLAAWLAAAGLVVNAPGHTAQFLKPRHAGAHQRICRTWQRQVWPAFVDQVRLLERPMGTAEWRRCNSVVISDALKFLKTSRARKVAVIYADPPYTKDQYSRYYHVYETLYLYDFPASAGEGRMRDGRVSSPFSLVSEVEDAFERLLGGTAALGVPLVLSYPTSGLLSAREVDTTDLIPRYFRRYSVTSISHQHSTMGASSGQGRIDATERIHVCIP